MVARGTVMLMTPETVARIAARLDPRSPSGLLPPAMHEDHFFELLRPVFATLPRTFLPELIDQYSDQHVAVEDPHQMIRHDSLDRLPGQNDRQADG